MGQIERLIQSYDTRVSLPWERNLAGPQRVWFAVQTRAAIWRFAIVCRVETVLRPYLEALS